MSMKPGKGEITSPRAILDKRVHPILHCSSVICTLRLEEHIILPLIQANYSSSYFALSGLIFYVLFIRRASPCANIFHPFGARKGCLDGAEKGCLETKFTNRRSSFFRI